MLSILLYGYKYTLDSDACEHQVGCGLLQEQPNGNKIPFRYWSRTLTTAERYCSTIEKEFFAAVWAVLTLCLYEYGLATLLPTDHEVLRWLLSLAFLTGRVVRWRLRLAEYECGIQYRPCVKH